MRLVARLKYIDEIRFLLDLGVKVILVDTPLTIKAINRELFKDLAIIKSHRIMVYLLINKIIHEEDFDMLDEILLKAKEFDVDGLIIADLSVMVRANDYDILDKVIYQPGTMNTNTFSNIYFSLKGIKGISISKELTLEEIRRFSLTKACELSLIGHGYIDMFYSKRKLIKNYFNYKGVKILNVQDNYFYRLKEQFRPDSSYPILEDFAGTHIFRDKPLESFNELPTLKEFIDDFIVERIFLEDEEYYNAIKAYENPLHVNDFLDKYHDTYTKGFYYQYTEKIKGEHSED